MDFAGFACRGLNTSDFRDSLVSPVSCFYFFGKIAKQFIRVQYEFCLASCTMTLLTMRFPQASAIHCFVENTIDAVILKSKFVKAKIKTYGVKCE